MGIRFETEDGNGEPQLVVTSLLTGGSALIDSTVGVGDRLDFVCDVPSEQVAVSQRPAAVYAVADKACGYDAPVDTCVQFVFASPGRLQQGQDVHTQCVDHCTY